MASHCTSTATLRTCGGPWRDAATCGRDEARFTFVPDRKWPGNPSAAHVAARHGANGARLGVNP
jgi:hypothetical protein